MNTIVLTGGGTAGHVTPHITLEKELKKHFEKIIYIGSKNGIEKQLIKTRTSFDYKEIETVKFVRKKLFKNILIPFKLSKAINDSKKILRETKPDIIFSKGGYVGLPVVIAGKKLGIPVVCHESDISMGLANKLAKKYANVICTNFASTANKHGKKCVHTGSPISWSNLTKSEAKNKLNISSQKPILLITGGSSGAKSINDFVFKNISNLTEKYYVIHLVGNGNLNKNITSKNYKQIEFSNDMKSLFKVADYAISRAGANTIFELLSNMVPTIFIPLPKGASRGDQIDNTNYLDSIDVSRTIHQENLSTQTLFKELDYLEKNAKTIKENIKKHNFIDGTEKIMQILLKEKIKH